MAAITTNTETVIRPSFGERLLATLERLGEAYLAARVGQAYRHIR